MKARVAASSGWPGEFTTSRTRDGAAGCTAGPTASRWMQRCGPSVFRRSNRLLRLRVNPGALLCFVWIAACLLIRDLLGLDASHAWLFFLPSLSLACQCLGKLPARCRARALPGGCRL